MTRVYAVSGMTCAHCEAAVREEVAGLEGVLVTDVSAQEGRLVVSADGPVDDVSVLAAVEEAGYTAVPA